MISPVLSTTSRLPLSLEFSEESSSAMRSGTAPVTRITSTWRRPATWAKEPEHRGVKRQPVDKTNLRRKACNHNPSEQLHWDYQAASSNRKLPELVHSITCSVITGLSWSEICLLESSSFLPFFYRTVHEQHKGSQHMLLGVIYFPYSYSFTYSSDQIPGIVGNTKIKTQALLSGCSQSKEETAN